MESGINATTMKPAWRTPTKNPLTSFAAPVASPTKKSSTAIHHTSDIHHHNTTTYLTNFASETVLCYFFHCPTASLSNLNCQQVGFSVPIVRVIRSKFRVFSSVTPMSSLMGTQPSSGMCSHVIRLGDILVTLWITKDAV